MKSISLKAIALCLAVWIWTPGWAGQNRWLVLGGQSYLTPDSLMDLQHNPLQAIRWTSPIIEVNALFQSRQHRHNSSIIKPAGMNTTAFPDQNWLFQRYRALHLNMLLPLRFGQLFIAASEARFTNPNWYSIPLYSANGGVEGANLSARKISLGFLYPFSTQWAIILELTPWNTYPFPDPYSLWENSIFQEDMYTDPMAREMMAAVAYRGSDRLEFSSSISRRVYRWKIPLANQNAHYGDYRVEVNLDWRVSLATCFRLSAHYLSWHLADRYLLYGYLGMPYSGNDLEIYRYQRPGHVASAGIAYFTTGRTTIGMALQIGRGVVRNWQEPQNETREELLSHWRYTIFLDTPLFSRLRFLTSFSAGAIHRYSLGIFRTNLEKNISRILSVGFQFLPFRHWQLQASMIPNRGNNLINSLLDGTPLYILTLQYSRNS